MARCSRTSTGSKVAPPAVPRSSPASSRSALASPRSACRGPRWASRPRPDDRAGPQERRLRYRPVRQEPPRRSQRAPANGAWLRRVLREPLSPQRRGRARVHRYPKDPKFKEKFGPRGVLKCKATDKDDATVDPVFGKVGKQTIENTARSPGSGWRRWTRSSSPRPSTSWRARRRRTCPGSATSIQRECTCSHI